MNLNLNEITFVIVTYKSESIIQDCLNTLPSESKKIIIENSNNINLVLLKKIGHPIINREYKKNNLSDFLKSELRN